MEVILQQDVDKLGHIGEIVRVKRGFARNFLLPRGLAAPADKKNLALLEHQKRTANAKRSKVRQAAEAEAATLAKVVLTISARAGEEDKLFGSVTNQDIQRALADQGIEIDRKRIHLEAPIKTLGDYEVVIHFATDVKTTIKLSVVRDEAS